MVSALGLRKGAGHEKISRRDREIMAKTVLIRPPGRARLIREIRKAVKAVFEERWKAEAEAEAKVQAKPKTPANGKARPPETK